MWGKWKCWINRKVKKFKYILHSLHYISMYLSGSICFSPMLILSNLHLSLSPSLSLSLSPAHALVGGLHGFQHLIHIHTHSLILRIPSWYAARASVQHTGYGTGRFSSLSLPRAACETGTDMTANSRGTKAAPPRVQRWLSVPRPGAGAGVRLLRYAALVAVCALCYSNSLWGEFVHDDIWAISNNPDVRPGSSLRSIFTNDFWGKRMADNTSHKSYRPLCILTFK